MVILLTLIHYIVCIFLIIVVLLQSGKAADLAGAFGGMGSQTVFGPRGSATVLSKATTGAAIVFMITSLALSITATRASKSGGGSLLDKAKTAPTAPVAPQKGNLPLNFTPINPDGSKGAQQTVPVPVVPPGQEPPVDGPSRQPPPPAK
jgi:preprotein translocase subunit SecG